MMNSETTRIRAGRETLNAPERDPFKCKGGVEAQPPPRHLEVIWSKRLLTNQHKVSRFFYVRTGYAVFYLGLQRRHSASGGGVNIRLLTWRDGKADFEIAALWGQRHNDDIG